MCRSAQIFHRIRGNHAAPATLRIWTHPAIPETGNRPLIIASRSAPSLLCTITHGANPIARLTLISGGGAYPNYHRLPAAPGQKENFDVKNLLLAAAALLATAPACAAEVGALGDLGEPGHYGQIEIDFGHFPHPQLLFPKPVVIRQVDAGDAGDPVYMYVPEKQAKNWRKHCQKYNACDQRVFFVEDNWYNSVYVPKNRAKPTKGTRKD